MAISSRLPDPYRISAGLDPRPSQEGENHTDGISGKDVSGDLTIGGATCSVTLVTADSVPYHMGTEENGRQSVAGGRAGASIPQ